MLISLDLYAVSINTYLTLQLHSMEHTLVHAHYCLIHSSICHDQWCTCGVEHKLVIDCEEAELRGVFCRETRL